MAEDKKAISIDKDDVDRAKAMLEVFEKMEEVIDRTRGITKQKQKITEQEIKDNQKILDLTKSIEKRKQRIVELEGNLTKELGVYQKMQETIKKHEDELVLSLDRRSKIQQNIADNEYKLQASNERTGIIKDQIRYQQTLLAQKEKQYQLEIASGKVTDRTRAARVREIGAIKDIIKAKEQEGKKEDYINSMLVKKVAGGLDAAKREEALQGVLNKQIATRMIEASQQKILVDNLKHKLNLEKVGLSNDERALALLKRQQAEHNRIIELKEKMARIGKEIENNLLSESKGYQKIKGLVTDIAKRGLTAYLAVVKASLDRWKELDAAALSFRQTTGFLTSQTKELDKAAREVNVQMAQLGVTIGEAYAAASALTNEFQVIGLVTKEAIANTAMMAANLGLNVQDAAKFKGLFESISQSAGSSGDSMIKSAAALAEMGGVAPKAVLNDMANASAETLGFLAKSPMALMRATVEARRLGTTVNSLSKSARGFLNYQDSITSELEASALIGKSLNFQEARAAAYAGDVVKARELALKQIEKAGDFTKLNVYQQEALARAAGMTTDEIIKQQNQQKLLAKLEQTRPELYKKYMEMQEKIKENEKAAAEDLERQAEEMAKRQLMQSEMNKLTSAFDSIWTNISDSLLAIANTIMPPILFVARLLGATFKVIGGLIRGILKPFDSIMEKFRSGNSSALKLEEIFVKIDSIAESLSKTMEGLGEYIGYAIMLGNQFFLILSGAFTLLSKFSSKITTSFEPLKGFGNSLLKLSEWVANIGNKLSGVFKIFKPFTSIFSTVFKVFSVVAKFLGPIGLIINAVQFVFSLFDRFSKIKWGDNIGENILLGLEAVGGALYDTLIQPFVDGYNWIKEKLMGQSPSEIGLGIVDGIKSIGGMLLDALTWPFRTVVNFVSKIFGGDGSIGDSIVNGIKSVMGGVFDILTFPYKKMFKFVSGLFSGSGNIVNTIIDGLTSIGSTIFDVLTYPFKTIVNFISGIFGGNGTVGTMIIDSVKNIAGTVFDFLVSPFKNAFEFVKKIPLVGKFFGGGDAAATVNSEIKSTVENQVAMAVEVKNINELKETVDKLTEAISRLGGVAGAPAPVVNVNNNQTAMVEKLDELIGLLSSGAIAVNMDGILVSKTLAKTS